MSESSLSDQFQESAKGSARPKTQKRPAPLSIRVSDEERAKLKLAAAGGSINGYVRNRLFGAAASPSRRVQRPNSLDHAALGRVLGTLGKSRLSSNLNQIAKAANMGALPVTPDLINELHTACADIQAMRHDLITAIGIKSE